jgi:hypothetical protein
MKYSPGETQSRNTVLGKNLITKYGPGVNTITKYSPGETQSRNTVLGETQSRNTVLAETQSRNTVLGKHNHKIQS